MRVRVQKLKSEAVIPTYAKHGDAGMDLTAIGYEYDEYDNIVYHTGLAFEIPEGYVGLIFPRSSNSKTDLMLTNHVGVIDSGYRGEVILKFRPTDDNPVIYNVGERVGQIIVLPYPKVVFDEVLLLSESERGTGGFGSSGK